MALRDFFQSRAPDHPFSPTADIPASTTQDAIEHVKASALDGLVSTDITDSTATGRDLLTATDASAARDVLELGSLAVQDGTLSAFGASLIDDADASTARSTLGLGTLATQSGTLSAFGATLIDDADASAARTTLGLGTFATASGTLSAFGATLIDDADAATARTTLGLGPLSSMAGSAADKLAYFSGAGTSAETAFTSFARTLLDDANAAAALSTLGIAAASESAQGIVELATSAEALAGSDTTRAVTSAGLASSKSLSGDGYMKMPGGLIIQWGTALGGAGTETFATTFPSACVAVVATSTTNLSRFVVTSSLSTSSFAFNTFQDTGTTSAVSATYIAIGY